MHLLGDLLEFAVRQNGSKKTLVQGGRELSYEQASRRLRGLAAGLHSLGIKPGEHIGILAMNCIEYWESYFAVHYAGVVLAPLNVRLSPAELKFIVQDGRLRALIVGPEFLPLVQALAADCPELEHLISIASDDESGLIGYDSLISQGEPLEEALRDWSEDDMINLCYTGGTTGLPKGVMLSQRNVVSNARHVVNTHGLCADDTWLHIAPLFHLADAWACFSFAMVGGRQVFAPTFSPQAFLETVQERRVTTTILVPAMINFLLNYSQAADYDSSSLRLMLVGGAPMPVDRILATRELFGSVLCQAYGMTETSPLLTSQRLEWLNYASEQGRRRLASCGRAVDGVAIRLVGPDESEPPVGECGELAAKGPNVMLGYWNQPEQTNAVLRDGWMHTGDVAYRDDEGYYYIVDRAKDMIISGGENVYSTEVESALYDHPGVLEAAVIGIPHDHWGEQVHAFVVLRPGSETTEDDLSRHCHERIAGFKCPRSFTFSEDPLPKSGPGKILKNTLRDPFWEDRDRKVN